MDAEKLYAMLEKVQAAKGYFFNADRDRWNSWRRF